MSTRWLVLAALVTALGLAQAAEKKEGHTGTKQSSRLYTAPDASDSGGLRGRIAFPPDPLVAAFAVPNSELARCYMATISKDGRAFEFNNLPTAKYDLLLVFPDMYYEGFTLNRSAGNLKTNEWKSILAILNKSEPFYEIKRIERLDGIAGEAGWAQAVFQQLRARPVTLQSAEVRSDIQIRTLKLARFENVGPAWQLLVTRELLRQEIAGKERKGLLPHYYAPDKLGSLRVVDSVKDLGELHLPEPK